MADFYNGESLLKISNKLHRQYGYLPFRTIIWEWILKYTDLAIKRFEQDKPEVGQVWELTETPLVLNSSEEKVWVYYVTDTRTRFLLASHAADSGSPRNAEIVILKAQKQAGKTPQKLIIDPANSFADKIILSCGCQIEYGQTGLLAEADKAGTKIVERFHGTIRDKSTIVCSFRSIETLAHFNIGWAVHYNYFKSLSILNGKTPAEAAGLRYEVKNWADFTRKPAAG